MRLAGSQGTLADAGSLARARHSVAIVRARPWTSDPYGSSARGAIPNADRAFAPWARLGCHVAPTPWGEP